MLSKRNQHKEEILYDYKTGKFIEIESRFVVPRGCWEGEWVWGFLWE
jgi:hypothetical protein